MKFKVNVPKCYRSCRWNGMEVKILRYEGNDAVTVNNKGKELRFNWRWLIPIDEK